MRIFTINAVVALITIAVVAVVGQGAPQDGVLPATNLDLNRVLVKQLQAQLVQKDAVIVGLKADVATCQANTEQAKRDLQSLTLTNEVQKTIEEMKETLGGDWVWNNDTRRIELVKSKPAEQPSAPAQEKK